MTMDDSELDGLLRRPLAPVRDQGFTARVAAKIDRRRKRRAWTVGSLLIAGLAPVLLFLPVAQAGETLARLVAQQALSPAAYGLAVLVLLWAWTPRLLRL